ncbi:hypothetical protein GWI33_001932 [Rhynchophorus ferrugineus]|uniref:Uncharacterized protein n=1 Tax=Rhynchophorus ferrugineus TaxID=354439 RepID=A0A834IMZ7_RHYFE|nr:hypothetical protein GWI33_001932 [Rhynchophorus ferrugineus]
MVPCLLLKSEDNSSGLDMSVERRSACDAGAVVPGFRESPIGAPPSTMSVVRFLDAVARLWRKTAPAEGMPQ